MELKNLNLEGADINHMFRLMFDNSPDYLLIVDPEMRILRANNLVAKKIGLENSGELEGRKCSEILEESCVSMFQNHIGRIDSLKKISKFVKRGIFLEGSKNEWYEVSVCPLNDDYGRPGMITLHIRDITSEKELEAKLAEQNERLWLLHEIDKSMHGVVEFNSYLQKIIGGIIKLGYNSASLFLVVEGEDYVQGVISSNLSKEEIMKIKIKVGEEGKDSIIGETIRTQKPLFINDVDKYLAENMSTKENLLRIMNGRSILCIPLIIENKVKGVMAIDNPERGVSFSRNDLQILELFTTKAQNANNTTQLF